MEKTPNHLSFEAGVCNSCGTECSGGKNTLACTWIPGTCQVCRTHTHVTKFRNFAFTKKLAYD